MTAYRLGGLGRGKPITEISQEDERPLASKSDEDHGFGNRRGFGGCDGSGSNFGGTKGFGGGFTSGKGFGGGDSSDTFGGGKSSSGCHKCGEEGHFARECPKGGGGTGRACYKCGEEGHFARECPQGGGPGRRGCYKCGKEGHVARDCTEEGESSGVRPGRSNDENCSGGGFGDSKGFGGSGGFGKRGSGNSGGFGESSGNGGKSFGFEKSGEDGEGGSLSFGKSEIFSGRLSRGFSKGGRGFGSNAENGSGDGFGKSEGFGGKSSGAFGRDSKGFGANKEGEGGRNGGSNECRRCGKEGHFARDCSEQPKCFNCGESGHQKSGCPNPPKPREPVIGEDGVEQKSVVYVPDSIEVDELFSQQIAAGLKFEEYFEIPVTVTGYDKDGTKLKIETFNDADMTDLLKENVRRMNYTKPTPVQQHALPVILKGRDLMACAQTGSGKTAAFLLPILSRILKDDSKLTTEFSSVQAPNAIIMAPTRELAVQISNEARKFAYGTMAKAVVCYGGVDVGHQRGQIETGCNILIGTPGRMLDFIEKNYVSLEKVEYLVLDEADRMLDLGFEPAIRELVGLDGMPGKNDRQTLMFSATFPREIQTLAREFLRADFVFVVVGVIGGANVDITQIIMQVEKCSKVEKLKEILQKDVEQSKDESGKFIKKTLVFVETKRTADFVASVLCLENYPSTSIHGDRKQKQREEALWDFKSGRCPVLVATAVAARGLDIKGVDHVVNYDLPSSIDDYVHRIGRTGRVGNPGLSTAFYDSQYDARIAKDMLKILSQAHQIVPSWLENEAECTVAELETGAVEETENDDAQSHVKEEDWE